MAMIQVVSRFPIVEDLVTVLNGAVQGSNRVRREENIRCREGGDVKGRIL